MRAIEITRYGAPEVLQLVEKPIPEPACGEVLIKVAASGINRPDVLQRMGHYPVPPGASDLPGLEVAGVVVGGDLQHPSNCWGVRKGDAVCALVQGGGYAEYCAAPLGQCLPIPAGLSLVEAASLPETFFTVWSNVFDRGHLGQNGRAPNETLLIQGGSSGIGVTAIQLGRALGHRVFVTAGNQEKCAACETLGAERAINYREEDFVEVVRDLTHGQGVDVILDMVAGSYVARELKCLADDGRLMIIALLGGVRGEVDFGQILRRRLTISGSTLRPRSVAFKAAIAAQLKERVWPLLEARCIRPVIHRIWPAEQVVQAHEVMDGHQHIGKLLLQWE